MVTTRKQAEASEASEAPDNLSKRPAPEDSNLKPPAGEDSESGSDSEPPTKKVRIETPAEEESAQKNESGNVRQAGTTERGHIYFFYRPRVQTDNPTSIDDVKNLHMLLVPRPPNFSEADSGAEPQSTSESEQSELDEMELIDQGADAVPARAPMDAPKQHYRLITIGKKTLPDPDARGRKESFWATVVAVGDDLGSLEKGLGEKTYETKTRGTRHDPPARLAARGCYALVNADAPTPSQETTYLGYALSHPPSSSSADFGPVQTALGLQRAAAFVLQVKNPHASAPSSSSSSSPNKNKSKHAVAYPPEIMDAVFGRGLRFAPCAEPGMLDYKGAELLLVAVRRDGEGLEGSLGGGRGAAMGEASEGDAEALEVGEIFRELWGGESDMPEALSGEWI